MITVSELDPEDWELFRDFRMQGLAEFPNAFGNGIREALEMVEHDWRPVLVEQQWLLARIDDAPVGIFGIKPNPRLPEGHEITGAWVHPNYRNGEVFDALIEEMLALCRDIGMSQAYAGVFVGNENARIAFEQRGFVLERTRQSFTRPELQAYDLVIEL